MMLLQMDVPVLKGSCGGRGKKRGIVSPVSLFLDGNLLGEGTILSSPKTQVPQVIQYRGRVRGIVGPNLRACDEQTAQPGANKKKVVVVVLVVVILISTPIKTPGKLIGKRETEKILAVNSKVKKKV